MGKFIFRFFIFLLIVAILSIAHLSYFGLTTDKFDTLIKNKANEVNKNVQLEFQKTKIHLNLTELNLITKLQNPKILIKGNTINLSKLNLFLSLKSFFSSDFLLKRAEVGFIKNDIKDITKITRIFLPKFINKKLNYVFNKGSIEGEILIPFNKDGSIEKNYGFTGKISDATIKLTKEFAIKNLTTVISHSQNNGFKSIIKKGFLYDVDLSESTINLTHKQDETKITSILKTKGKINSSQIKLISSLLKIDSSILRNISSDINLITNLSFDLYKKFKIKNLLYSIEGSVDHFEADTKERTIVKKYLTNYNPKIILKNNKIKISNLKNDINIELDGLVKIKDKFNKYKCTEVYNLKTKKHILNGMLELTNFEVQISRLNYKKNIEKESEVIFDLNFILDKYYSIEDLSYSAEKTTIIANKIKFNKDFELIDLKEINIKTFSNKIKNNDFSIINNKQIIIKGEVFDAQPLLKSLYKKTDKKTFSKNFNSNIKINFVKALAGTNDDVSDFSMIGTIKKGSFDKLSLKGNFSDNEIIEMSIYQIDKDIKTLQVISDRARPFVKHYDFIKGFEGGKLEYETVIKKGLSNSILKIEDFKVSKVPALAQLLTLASLQGIADTLSGEGIRFESFEMKSNTKGNVMNIEDALAMGPAVSILLSGYVDKGKVVSLRGTLVPATKLNSIIASIPLVGDILVGKKTGEGVVGVSFKMKGPPKDIKTTVNPIKTLTPRFIVRAIEKMKKKKQEETK